MSTSAAHKLANARYRQSKRKTIAADVPKEKGEMYQAFAAQKGFSLSLLVQKGIEEFIQRHGGEVHQPAPITTQPQPKIPAQDKQLLDAASNLSTDQKKALLKFLQSLSKAENTAKNASADNHKPI